MIMNQYGDIKVPYHIVRYNNYIKFTNIQSHFIHPLIQINKQLKCVMFTMRKNEIPFYDYLEPSIVKAYHSNSLVKPFWNKKIQQLSDKLFLPSHDNLYQIKNKIKTFNYLNWFNVEQYSGFDKEFYNLKTKDHKNEPKKIVKCKQIKLFLNLKQREYMIKIIGIYRYFYNRCVSYLNNYDKNTRTSWFYVDPNKKTRKINVIVDVNNNPYNIIAMRQYLVDDWPEWILEGYPKHLIREAQKEAFQRFQTCLDQCIKKHIVFDFKYKSKKEIIQTINLDKQMISTKKNGIFTSWKIENAYMFKYLKTSEKIPSNFVGSNISYHRILKTFMLNLNYNSMSTTTKNKEVCAIDQGIKNPFTIYAPNKVIIIGNEASDKLYKLCKEMDIILSRMNSETYYKKHKMEDNQIVKQYYNVNSKRKSQLRKALHRKIQKVKNLVKELHYKTIKYLCDTFKTIILPPFETQKMAGKLNNEMCRKMFTLSFYTFKMKLINKAKEKGVKIHHLNEPYTSKTCGKCGNVKHNLKNDNVYVCNICNLVISRDINGARNILLRNAHLI